MSKEKLDQNEIKSLLKDDRTMAAVADAMQKAAVNVDTYEFSPDTRSIFTAENLDPVIKTIVPTATPIRSLFPRVTGQGQATSWKILKGRLDPQTAGTDTDITFADAGEPNETSQDYEVKSAAFKLLGRKLDVGMKHIAAAQGYQSVEDELLRVKTLEVMLGEEDLIINGDSGTNSDEFDGLLKQISTNEDSTTEDLTVSGIAEQDQKVFDQGGVATHLFLNPKQSRELSDEMQKDSTINRIVVDNQGAATASLRVSSIISPVTGNTIQLVTSRYLGGNAILGSVQSPAGENWVEMEDLIPLVSMDVPNTNFAKTKFVVQSTVLKLIAEPFWAKYTNLNS